MRYKFTVRGEVSVNERDIQRALDAFEVWARGLGAADEVALCQAGIYGVDGVDLSVDMTSSHRMEGRPVRSRRDRRGRSSSDGILPIDLDRKEGL